MVWQLFAVAYPAEFFDQIVKKLSTKNAAQKIDEALKIKEESYYPFLKQQSDAHYQTQHELHKF